MGKRGRRRALYKNEKKHSENEDEFYYKNLEEESKTIECSDYNIDQIERNTNRILSELCKDYRGMCDCLKYIDSSDIRRFVIDHKKYTEMDAWCAPVLDEFLECAIYILMKENKKMTKISGGKYYDETFDNYDVCLKSFRFQLCLTLSKYYIRKPTRKEIILDKLAEELDR
jgi:hypothetical protein